MKKKLLEVKEGCKSFVRDGIASHVLQNICMTIHQGDVYGIVGMSGAGKTTLLRCFVGLERLDDGTIYIQGQEISNMKDNDWRDLRKNIGMVFQHFHLFSSRTVRENIAYPMEIYGVSETAQRERVEELLSLVGLAEKGDSYPSQLSGGEKQRVAIARALANNSEILLFDEPTSALDSKTTQEILILLRKLNQDFGLTLVIITHQLEVVKQICTRVAVLSEGKVLEEGETFQIFSKPTHRLTSDLFSERADHIPKAVLARINDNKNNNKCLIRLHFEGDLAREPIISRMIKGHEVEVNILFGSIDSVQERMVGKLLVELLGVQKEISHALEFLTQHKVKFEVIS